MLHGLLDCCHQCRSTKEKKTLKNLPLEGNATIIIMMGVYTDSDISYLGQSLVINILNTSKFVKCNNKYALISAWLSFSFILYRRKHACFMCRLVPMQTWLLSYCNMFIFHRLSSSDSSDEDEGTSMHLSFRLVKCSSNPWLCSVKC